MNYSTGRILRLTVLCVAAALLLLPLHPARGQSGRTKREDQEKPPVKSKPLPPLPRPPIEPPPDKSDAIRINNDLVTIVATVVTPQGAPPPTLRAEDFEVLEDNVPQELTNFARDADAPLRLVMLFDTSLSVASRLNFEKKAAAKFFEHVIRRQDQAAVFSFSTDVEIIQDFTNKVPQLINATKQLKSGGATSLYDAIFLASNYLEPAPGRHVIVVVSDGGDTTSGKDLKQSLRRAQQADAVIYSVYTGNLLPSMNLRDLAGERALATLTADTGGEFYHPTINLEERSSEEEQALRQLDGAFAALAEQLRTQYILGFYSKNETRDGGFRKLAVRVKKEGCTVRARAGYYAPKD